MLLKRPQPQPDQPPQKPSENDQPADFIGLTDGNSKYHTIFLCNSIGRIVFFSSAADIEEKIKIPKPLLRVYEEYFSN